MKINAANATSLQQRAYLLLYNMVTPSVRSEMENPPEPLPSREIRGPGRDLLASEARVMLWNRMQEGPRRPYVYNTDALRNLWIQRRQVYVIWLYKYMCTIKTNTRDIMQVWPTVIRSLGTDTGLQSFLERLSAKYVEAINLVSTNASAQHSLSPTHPHSRTHSDTALQSKEETFATQD